jgi:MFS family permease
MRWSRHGNKIAVIAAMTISTIVYSLSFPLISGVLNRQGFDHDAIGLTASLQALGALLMAPLSPVLVRRFGMKVVMLACLATLAALILAAQTASSIYAWSAFRLTFGMGGALLWVVGEAWINILVDDDSRGRFVAGYITALGAGYALGPVVLSALGTFGSLPFVASATIIAIAAVPLLIVRDARSSVSRAPGISLLLTVRRAPLPMLTNLVCAMATSILMTFFVLYAAGAGLSEPLALYILSTMAVGAGVVQPLVGWLADCLNRRTLLVIYLGAMFLGTCAMPVALLSPLGALAYALVYGGLRGSLYSLSLTLIGDEFEGSELLSASAAFNLLGTIGRSGGPLVGGYAMLIWNGHGMPALVAALVALLLALVGTERWLRSSPK